MNVFDLEPWDGATYSDAIREQRRLTEAGETGWLFFCCAPTITYGKRGPGADVLATPEILERLGVRLLEQDRGGLATYHGPGQIIGFPVGTLEAHTGDSRGVKIFVEKLHRLLCDFAEDQGLTLAEREATGVWITRDGVIQKLVSIGLSFSREGIGHGFALNVQPEALRGFEWINPCGEPNARMASLFRHTRPVEEFHELKEQLISRFAAMTPNIKYVKYTLVSKLH